MSKKQIIWLVFVGVAVLPSALYLLVNGYWWLFDGNHPIQSKMMVAGWVTGIGTMVIGMWGYIGDIWR